MQTTTIEVYGTLVDAVVNTSSIPVSGLDFTPAATNCVFNNSGLQAKTIAAGLMRDPITRVVYYELFRLDLNDVSTGVVNRDLYIIQPSGNIAIIVKVPEKEIPDHHRNGLPERYGYFGYSGTSPVQVY